MSAGTSYDRGAARQIMVTTALRLVAVSVAFGLLSGTVSVVTGLQDHSLGVFGIGLGVLADVTGSAVLVWRFRAERRQPMRSGTAETSAAVIVSAALAVVSLVLIIQSVLALAARSRPGTSSVTLIAAGVSLAVLAPLAVAKRRLGKRMSSRALQGDGALSGIGAATSLLALAALGLNDSLGWWWADRVAALVVAAVAAAEAWRTAGITRRLAQPFASTAKRTDGRLEEGQAGAHHLGVLRVAAPWTAFGFIAERTACREAFASATLARAFSSGASSRSAYRLCARSSARRWISDQRAPASAAAGPPAASDTLIAS